MSAAIRYHPHFEMGNVVGMAVRAQNKLTDIVARSAKLEPGRHSDGGGLYLNVTPAGSKSWLFMWSRSGKRREMGLGAYPTVSLAKARKLATEHREAVADGRDPIAERVKEVEPTFGECADMLIASMEASWQNAKHRAQWRMTLGDRYCKAIRGKRASAISTQDVLSVLTPVWSLRPETASRLRGRIERVLDFAKAKGWRSGENPALWRGHLRNVLPARTRLSVGHHAAMDYASVAGLLQALHVNGAMPAKALEFTILTAARSGETRGALWSEFDLSKAIWTVPAQRMKAGKEHRVPLPSRVIELLLQLQETQRGDYVFAGRSGSKPIGSRAMDLALTKQHPGLTVHGFRSAFRDWCGNETSFPREVAEAALAHSVGDAVERAYRRGDALEKRRQLMEAWATYLSPLGGKNVIAMPTGRKG